jgi:hypothetical protein
MPKPKVKGSGEAYQSWNSAQAMETAKITAAVTPVGLRPPVSVSATSFCSDSGAFSRSVAMCAPHFQMKRGEVALRPWYCRRNWIT